MSLEIGKYIQTELAGQMLITPKMLRVVEREDSTTIRARIVTLYVSALTSPVWHLEYPADWWQAFKRRWFPRWLKHRFPVQMTVHDAARYCPHMGVGDTEPHLAFLDGVEAKA